MRWFRANSKFGGRLALMALALQFYLSFGHIHPEDIYGSARLSLSAATPAALPAASLRSLPTDTVAKLPDDVCAICATMYLLGNTFVAEPPRLPSPPTATATGPLPQRQAVFIAPRRTPFQSRAPPLA